jgi:hypothetical protein
MEGGGLLTLAGMLVFGIPFALFKLLVVVPYGLYSKYNSHFAKLGPREAALAEASHGAAMIVLPGVALFRHSAALPSWLTLALVGVMICGGFRFFNGAKFSVGWRDPKLMARAALRIALAVWLFHALDVRQFGNIPPMFNPLLSLLGWWLVVVGTTKLVLVLRGFPAAPWDGQKPQTPHGSAPFTNPNDAAKGLSK